MRVAPPRRRVPAATYMVGVVREGFGAKEERGAKRAWCEEGVVRR